MVPPEGIEVVGVKARVTGTDDLPAMRSMGEMTKETDDTSLGMPPDAIASAFNELTVTGSDWSL